MTAFDCIIALPYPFDRIWRRWPVNPTTTYNDREYGFLWRALRCANYLNMRELCTILRASIIHHLFKGIRFY